MAPSHFLLFNTGLHLQSCLRMQWQVEMPREDVCKKQSYWLRKWRVLRVLITPLPGEPQVLLCATTNRWIYSAQHSLSTIQKRISILLGRQSGRIDIENELNWVKPLAGETTLGKDCRLSQQRFWFSHATDKNKDPVSRLGTCLYPTCFPFSWPGSFFATKSTSGLRLTL